MAGKHVEWRLDTEAAGHWRWRLIGPDGWPLAISPVSYRNRDDAIAAIETICASCRDAKIVDSTDRGFS